MALDFLLVQEMGALGTDERPSCGPGIIPRHCVAPIKGPGVQVVQDIGEAVAGPGPSRGRAQPRSLAPPDEQP